MSGAAAIHREPDAAVARALLRETTAGIAATAGLVALRIVHPEIGPELWWGRGEPSQAHEVGLEIAAGGWLAAWIKQETPTKAEAEALSRLAEIVAGFGRLIRSQAAQLETERQRLARDLHDGPLQALFAAEMDLRATDSSNACERAKKAVGAARHSVRRLLEGLDDPNERAETGREDAVTLLAAAVASFERTFRIRMLLMCTDRAITVLGGLSSDRGAIAARVVHESAVNARRHGGAEEIRAVVRVGRNGDRLIIAVTDDGVGLPSHPQPSYGVRSLRRSLASLDGTLRLSRRRRGGTRVVATLPLWANHCQFTKSRTSNSTEGNV
jgi:signal transduction histidine kinase